ncbi:hypothetical protein ACFLZG_06485, partial [Thermodesulfobacteriota bacterium]
MACLAERHTFINLRITIGAVTPIPMGMFMFFLSLWVGFGFPGLPILIILYGQMKGIGTQVGTVTRSVGWRDEPELPFGSF